VRYRQRAQRQGDIIVFTLAVPSPPLILREFAGFILGGRCQNTDLQSHFLPPQTCKWVSGNPKTGIAEVSTTSCASRT